MAYRADEDIHWGEAGAPSGAKLVAWFKKAHPRKAARIERKLTRELWNGG
jgi:hypothetical protein